MGQMDRLRWPGNQLKKGESTKMAQVGILGRDVVASGEARSRVSQRSYEAYQILRFGFIVAPIVAGLDKFFNLLVNWNQYLPGFVNNLVGGRGHQLMMLVGAIEIAAGIGVAIKP